MGQHDSHISHSTANAHAAEAVFHVSNAPLLRMDEDGEFQEVGFSSEVQDGDRPQEECGVFGVFAPGLPVARRTFFGIFALQHRGQESCGIAVSDGEELRIHADMGLVSQVFNEGVLAELPGHIAVGHNRYSTTGGSVACNSQPMRCHSSDGELALAHNGNLVNVVQLRRELEAEGAHFETTMDTEIISKLLARHADLPLEEALLKMMETVSGAYSLVMMTRDTLIAVRDPSGLRPLCLGRLKDCQNDDCYVVASETCALGPGRGGVHPRNRAGGDRLHQRERRRVVALQGRGAGTRAATGAVRVRVHLSRASRFAVARPKRPRRAAPDGNAAGQTKRLSWPMS